MKNTKFLLYLLLFIFIFSCKDDDCDVNYKTYEVDFYKTHKDFVVKPAVIDTIPEILLVKEAHYEGATFETESEIVIFQQAYRKYQIMDSMIIQIETDSETNDISEIVCYRFFEEEEFIVENEPSVGISRGFEKVLQQGTGLFVPATYDTLNVRRTVSNAELLPNIAEQLFNRISFKIPEERSITGHFDYFLEEGVKEHCKEGNSYKIHY